MQITTMQRVKAMAIALLAGAAVFVAGAAAGYAAFGRGDSGEPPVVALPTACDNFLAASAIFASQGPDAVIPATGADPLSIDAEAQAYETLRGLLDSCGSDLALRVK